jgi:hypothetical protein
MNQRKAHPSSITSFKVLVILGVILLVAVAALAAGPSINSWLISPGGGYLDGAGINVHSAIGQPFGGSVSNGLTLCSGLLCGSGASATGKTFVYLPEIFNNNCNGFNGPGEIEPNNTQLTANGPLCFGQNYSGSPDDNRPGAEYDLFYIDLPAGSGVKVTLTGFLADAQLILLEDASGAVAGRDHSQASGNYQVNYDGSMGAGRYLIMLFAPANHPTGNGDYTLMAELK